MTKNCTSWFIKKMDFKVTELYHSPERGGVQYICGCHTLSWLSLYSTEYP